MQLTFGLKTTEGSGVSISPSEKPVNEERLGSLSSVSANDEDVGGLDIPVDDAGRMRGIKGVCDLDTKIKHRFDLQRLTSNPVAKSLPFQQFHGDEASASDSSIS